MDTAERLLRIVEAQANDAGLWFVAQTAPEGYLQSELRRLHAAVESHLSSSESKGMVMVSVEQLKALREQVVTLQTRLHELDGILSKESAAHYDASVDRPASPAPIMPEKSQAMSAEDMGIAFVKAKEYIVIFAYGEQGARAWFEEGWRAALDLSRKEKA